MKAFSSHCSNIAACLMSNFAGFKFRATLLIQIDDHVVNIIKKGLNLFSSIAMQVDILRMRVLHLSDYFVSCDLDELLYLRVFSTELKNFYQAKRSSYFLYIVLLVLPLVILNIFLILNRWSSSDLI